MPWFGGLSGEVSNQLCSLISTSYISCLDSYRKVKCFFTSGSRLNMSLFEVGATSYGTYLQLFVTVTHDHDSSSGMAKTLIVYRKFRQTCRLRVLSRYPHGNPHDRVTAVGTSHGTLAPGSLVPGLGNFHRKLWRWCGPQVPSDAE